MNKEAVKFKIACGTDDGQDFTSEHFGDSKNFLIYEYDSETREIVFLSKINNNSKEEEMHGDSEKAKGISGILKDIPVLLAFVMGPNINRMKKKFIPIISREKNISKTLGMLKKIIPEIIQEIKQIKEGDNKVFVINK